MDYSFHDCCGNLDISHLKGSDFFFFYEFSWTLSKQPWLMLVINFGWIFYSTVSPKIIKRKMSWWKWYINSTLSLYLGRKEIEWKEIEYKNFILYFVLGLQASSMFRKVLPNVTVESLQTSVFVSTGVINLGNFFRGVSKAEKFQWFM